MAPFLSSLSLVSLHHGLAVLLTATCAGSPVESRGHGHACHCRSCALQLLLAVVVVVRWLMSLVGCWLSFAARGHLCTWWSIGRLTYSGWPVLFEVVGVV